MYLGHAAIARLKEEKDQCMKMQNQPFVDEIMPLKLKANFGGKESLTIGKETCDKKSWMSSVQLWSAETKLVNLIP